MTLNFFIFVIYLGFSLKIVKFIKHTQFLNERLKTCSIINSNASSEMSGLSYFHLGDSLMRFSITC